MAPVQHVQKLHIVNKENLRCTDVYDLEILSLCPNVKHLILELGTGALPDTDEVLQSLSHLDHEIWQADAIVPEDPGKVDSYEHEMETMARDLYKDFNLQAAGKLSKLERIDLLRRLPDYSDMGSGVLRAIDPLSKKVEELTAVSLGPTMQVNTWGIWRALDDLKGRFHRHEFLDGLYTAGSWQVFGLQLCVWRDHRTS